MAVVILRNRNAQIEITDSGGTARDLTAYWINGHPELSDDVVDVVTFADLAHRNNPGLQNATVRLTFNDFTLATNAAYKVVTDLLASNTTGRSVVYYPDGTASGKPKVTVPMRVMRVAFAGGVGEQLTFDAEFAVDGTRTIGTV